LIDYNNRLLQTRAPANLHPRRTWLQLFSPNPPFQPRAPLAMQDPRSVRKHLLVDPLRRRSNLRVRFRMHTLSMCTLGLHPPTRVFNAVPAKTDVQFPLAKAFLAEKYPDESSLDAVIGVDLHHTPPPGSSSPLVQPRSRPRRGAGCTPPPRLGRLLPSWQVSCVVTANETWCGCSSIPHGEVALPRFTNRPS
jgi:hypothetical protein